MSQATRFILGFLTFLVAITVAHGCLNFGWLEDRARPSMTVGHLPVT